MGVPGFACNATPSVCFSASSLGEGAYGVCASFKALCSAIKPSFKGSETNILSPKSDKKMKNAKTG